jgi:hypothetical protein
LAAGGPHTDANCARTCHKKQKSGLAPTGTCDPFSKELIIVSLFWKRNLASRVG